MKAGSTRPASSASTSRRGKSPLPIPNSSTSNTHSHHSHHSHHHSHHHHHHGEALTTTATTTPFKSVSLSTRSSSNSPLQNASQQHQHANRPPGITTPSAAALAASMSGQQQPPKSPSTASSSSFMSSDFDHADWLEQQRQLESMRLADMSLSQELVEGIEVFMNRPSGAIPERAFISHVAARMAKENRFRYRPGSALPELALRRAKRSHLDAQHWKAQQEAEEREIEEQRRAKMQVSSMESKIPKQWERWESSPIIPLERPSSSSAYLVEYKKPPQANANASANDGEKQGDANAAAAHEHTVDFSTAHQHVVEEEASDDEDEHGRVKPEGPSTGHTTQRSPTHGNQFDRWRKRVFPSLIPATREQVKSLEEFFKTSLLSSTEDASPTHATDSSATNTSSEQQPVSEAQILARELSLIDTTMSELVRQVSTDCRDRGSLLSHLYELLVKRISDCPKKIAELERNITSLSTQMAMLDEELESRAKRTRDLEMQLVDAQQKTDSLRRESDMLRRDLRHNDMMQTRYTEEIRELRADVDRAAKWRQVHESTESELTAQVKYYQRVVLALRSKYEDLVRTGAAAHRRPSADAAVNASDGTIDYSDEEDAFEDEEVIVRSSDRFSISVTPPKMLRVSPVRGGAASSPTNKPSSPQSLAQSQVNMGLSTSVAESSPQTSSRSSEDADDSMEALGLVRQTSSEHDVLKYVDDPSPSIKDKSKKRKKRASLKRGEFAAELAGGAEFLPVDKYSSFRRDKGARFEDFQDEELQQEVEAERSAHQKVASAAAAVKVVRPKSAQPTAPQPASVAESLQVAQDASSGRSDSEDALNLHRDESASDLSPGEAAEVSEVIEIPGKEKKKKKKKTASFALIEDLGGTPSLDSNLLSPPKPAYGRNGSGSNSGSGNNSPVAGAKSPRRESSDASGDVWEKVTKLRKERFTSKDSIADDDWKELLGVKSALVKKLEDKKQERSKKNLLADPKQSSPAIQSRRRLSSVTSDSSELLDDLLADVSHVESNGYSSSKASVEYCEMAVQTDQPDEIVEFVSPRTRSPRKVKSSERITLPPEDGIDTDEEEEMVDEMMALVKRYMMSHSSLYGDPNKADGPEDEMEGTSDEDGLPRKDSAMMSTRKQKKRKQKRYSRIDVETIMMRFLERFGPYLQDKLMKVQQSGRKGSNLQSARNAERPGPIAPKAIMCDSSTLTEPQSETKKRPRRSGLLAQLDDENGGMPATLMEFPASSGAAADSAFIRERFDASGFLRKYAFPYESAESLRRVHVHSIAQRMPKSWAWLSSSMEKILSQLTTLLASPQSQHQVPPLGATALKFFSAQFGLHTLFQQSIVDFYRAVLAFSLRDAYTELFRRFLDDEYNVDQLAFFVSLRSAILPLITASSAVSESSSKDSSLLVAKSFLSMERASTLVHRFFAHRSPQDRGSFLTELESACEYTSFSEGARKIDTARFLHLCVLEYRKDQLRYTLHITHVFRMMDTRRANALPLADAIRTTRSVFPLLSPKTVEHWMLHAPHEGDHSHSYANARAGSVASDPFVYSEEDGLIDLPRFMAALLPRLFYCLNLRTAEDAHAETVLAEESDDVAHPADKQFFFEDALNDALSSLISRHYLSFAPVAKGILSRLSRSPVLHESLSRAYGVLGRAIEDAVDDRCGGKALDAFRQILSLLFGALLVAERGEKRDVLYIDRELIVYEELILARDQAYCDRGDVY